MSRVARRPTEFARTAMSARTRDRDDLAARSMLRGASPRTTASITEAGGGTQESGRPRDLVAGGAHSPPEKRGPVRA